MKVNTRVTVYPSNGVPEQGLCIVALEGEKYVFYISAKPGRILDEVDLNVVPSYR